MTAYYGNALTLDLTPRYFENQDAEKFTLIAVSMIPLHLLVAFGIANGESSRLIGIGSIIFGLIMLGSFLIFGRAPHQRSLEFSLVWAIAISVSLLSMEYGWIPIYSIAADAATYFDLAKNLASNNWTLEQGLNYKGIVYLYAALFEVLGASPLSIYLLNLTLFFCASFLIVRAAFSSQLRTRKFPTFIFLIALTPEMLWFVGISGKDSITASLSVITVILGAKSFGILRTSHRLIFSLLFASSAVGLGLIRTPILIAVLLSILLATLLPSRWPGVLLWFRKTFVVSFSVFILFALVQALGSLLGNSENTLTTTVSAISPAPAQSFDGLSIDNLNATKELVSISQTIIPSHPAEIPLSAFIRSWGYLLSPWPNLPDLSLESQFDTATFWSYGFRLLGLISIVLLIPLVGISSYIELRNKHSNQVRRLFVITFLTSVVAVSAGTMIVHDRYRLVFAIWLIPAAWGSVGFLGKRAYWLTLSGWMGIIIVAVTTYSLLKNS